MNTASTGDLASVCKIWLFHHAAAALRACEEILSLHSCATLSFFCTDCESRRRHGERDERASLGAVGPAAPPWRGRSCSRHALASCRNGARRAALGRLPFVPADRIGNPHGIAREREHRANCGASRRKHWMGVASVHPAPSRFVALCLVRFARSRQAFGAHSGMSRARHTIGVLERIHPAAMELLAQSADVIAPGEADAARQRCHALIVRGARVTADDVASAPLLKVIGKHGAGTDNIDVSAAEAAGIRVLSTPGVNAPSVADLAVAFALNLIRNIGGHDAALRAGRLPTGSDLIGYELAELPCGILGLGAIGSAVAHRLKYGFGCTVSAVDPGIAEHDWPEGIGRHDDLSTLLAGSRLLFIHVPLDEITRGMIDAKMLGKMPRGAYLVNCARGGIVDEEALAQCLREGHLAGAASDVFSVEPPAADHPLLACANFLATPHLGASTNGGLERVGVAIAQKVLDALADTENEHRKEEMR
ncbi:NAD(P)-dependent oxidoreductase [Roseitranquillus sediminis]|uniref:NAD(P)-dependent oxidoreductase n=1 Tax=Roseitranquillus sediminis TaxID=2809051 RepID=UPI001D0C8047|nr:NAD(P)-dependent oxidoreductase [Roseitranquillus sediminis]MBM9595414.1 hypothetical protein [Roseitranquillus sediminis]